MNKFDNLSREHGELLKLKASFELEFGADAAGPMSSPSSSGVHGDRVSGMCDFTIEGGRQPVDVTRSVELPAVALDEFNQKERQGLKGKKRIAKTA